MSPETIFQLCSGMAFIGWLLLLTTSPFIQETDRFIVGIIITLLCIVYAWLIFSSFGTLDLKKFSSLDGVMELFGQKTLVTAGWVHYLAFDLLTGCWIKRNSAKYGIPHTVIIPCLLFTFMLGPVGLLLYLLLRFFRSRSIFAANY